MTTSDFGDDDGWPQPPSRRDSWLEALAVPASERGLSCASTGSRGLGLGDPFRDLLDPFFGPAWQDQRLPCDEFEDDLLGAGVRDSVFAATESTRTVTVLEKTVYGSVNIHVPEKMPCAAPPALTALKSDFERASAQSAQSATQGPSPASGLDTPAALCFSAGLCAQRATPTPAPPPTSASGCGPAFAPAPAPVAPSCDDAAVDAAALARANRQRAISRWLEKRRRRQERGAAPSRRFVRRAEIARSRKRVRGRFAQEGPVWRPANQLP